MKFSRELIEKTSGIENVKPSFIEKGIEKGSIVFPRNLSRKLKRPVAIGKGLNVKINANLGTSTECRKLSDEILKLETAVKYGADTVMDLSTGGDLARIRKEIVKNSPVPVGTVPIYEAALEAEKKRGSFEKMTRDDILDTLERQARDGVDFFTIHAGIKKQSLDILKEEPRTAGIVSRGGAILARWMYVNNKENPLYENFDLVLDIAEKYDITISLGDALRPGSLEDSTDMPQISELYVLAELVRHCRRRKVQVMVEGPGHIRLDQIKFNMELEKRLCLDAPFYVLGPLPTDIAFGYDHIASSIGGALAALHGADFLCVVTPAEHLGHPRIEDIKLGVIASKISAHSVDILRNKKEWEKDVNLSRARARRQWDEIFKYALDPGKAESYRGKNMEQSRDMCSMCGKFCSLKLIEECDFIK